MSYYLVFEGRAKPLVYTESGWYWGRSSYDRTSFLPQDLQGEHQIMEAENAADTGYSLDSVRYNCGRGVLDENGYFYGCHNGGHGKLIAELLDYHEVDKGYAKDRWVCVYEEGVMELYDTTSFQRRVETEGYRLNDAQNFTLERLGFDTETYERRRSQVPEYEDVFSDDNPAYPPRECTARVVQDVQEVKDWMQEREAQFTERPGW